MDKESKLSPAIQPFIPKLQRREGMDSRDLPSASSPPLRLPNPHVSEQSTRGNQATWRQETRQRPPTTDGMRPERGDTAGKHGYSNNRRARGPAEGNTNAPRERSIRDKQTKMSKYITDSPSQDKIMGKRSLDIPKRDFRGTRSAPNSAERPRSAQTESVKFEVKMADFPELRGSPAFPAPQKVGVCWGPTPPTPNPPTLKPEFTSKTLPARKGQRHEPDRSASDIKPVSSVITPGHLTEALSKTNGSGPAVTSWANVASQPPKKPAPKEKITTSTSTTQKEEMSAQLEEGASEKKKRRKKKKKSGGVGEEAEPEDPVIHQQPPKFEDEEEFPDLALAFSGTPRLLTSSNTAKLCTEESQKEGSQPHSTDQSKDKASAGKPLPVETAKKGQKSEKTSGKKSKVPVQLDIGNMLAALEKKQQSQKAKQDAKPIILSVGGALPVGLKQPVAQKKPPWQQEKIAHNPLDSTSPLVKKGKQREVPKPKKPTPLKRVILKEREERKQNRLLEERGLPPGGESTPANDDNAEEEETCDANGTDQEERGSPTMGLEDQADGDEISETEGEGEGEGEEKDKEKDKEETEEQQQTTQTLPCLPNRPKIHSRKFRDYCSQVLSKDVDECVTALLKELVRFQDRLYQKDPMKARMRRRLVMGLREVLKHLKLRKVKCVVISPNCERIQSKGGLDEALHTIIDTCREQGVPFVFALSRKTLGRCVNKAVPVSLVGIFNYDGAQDYYHKMIELSSEARRAYEVMVANLELAGQAEAGQEGNPEQPSPEPQPGPDTTQQEEPEYIKLWKRMLEKECNHKFLNYEEQLSSMHLASECTEQTDEEERS